MQLRTFTPYFILLLACFGTQNAFAQLPTAGKAYLSGQQEAMPLVSAGSGTVDVDFTTTMDGMVQVVVSGSFAGLSSPLATNISKGAHIHIGYPGRNGGIALSLNPTLAADSLSGTFQAAENTFTVDPADFAAAEPSALYVNLHTRNHPGGELRGTIYSRGTEGYYANLFGSNLVPSIITTAYGALALQLDGNTLTAAGSFTGLSDTLATRIAGGGHLHIGLPGENGAVDLRLTATLDDGRRSGVFRVADNTFTLTDDQAARVRQGGYYANLHSGTYPSGELRGQVLPMADQVFRAHLSGANEWPVVTSEASGQVIAHLSGNTLRLIGSFNDLSAPVAVNIGGGAHLHPAYAGSNGPVAVALKPNLMPDSLNGSFLLADNQYELSDEQRMAMLDRGIYLNIHSRMHPAGELRGQVLPESQAIFTAFLNGNQQNPTVGTRGRGMVKVEMMGDRMTATGSFSGLMSALNTSIAGGSHLHAGYPGQSGPVIYPLTAMQVDDDTSGVYTPDMNTFLLSGGRTDTLMDRFFYVNVHSLDYPAGEIRGNVLAEAESYFLAPLSGASQPMNLSTPATGMVAAEVTDTMVTLVGSFEGLESDFASSVAGGMHLHNAVAGSNGGIVTAINTELAGDLRSGTILADSNRLMLTMEQRDAMFNREVYANVHTAAYMAGAIRGQVLPLAGSYFHTTLSGANATTYVMSSAQGGLKMELIDNLLKVSGSVTMLEGDFDASIAGGAHLHLAPAGQNGAIALPLRASASEDLKSVTFAVDSNMFTISDSLVMDLYAGRLYANVHTSLVPSGEARGQVRNELNLPPMASAILNPMEGDTLRIEGGGNEPFTVTFAPTTDPNQDTVIYLWQLATDADFETVIFGGNGGRDTFFTADLNMLDMLLEENGVEVEDSVTLYHRVLASDGSNYTPGDAVSVRLVRGTVTSTQQFRPQGFSASVFPNPADRGGRLTYEVQTREAFSGRLYLYSSIGQLLQQRTVEIVPGDQRIPVDASALAPGQYFINLRHADGRMVHITRVVVH